MSGDDDQQNGEPELPEEAEWEGFGLIGGTDFECPNCQTGQPRWDRGKLRCGGCGRFVDMSVIAE